AGSGLEIEIGRRFAHLRLELLDERRKILGGVMRARFCNATPLLLLALFALGPRVGDARDEPHLIDALLHADGRDAVLEIVRGLNHAAAPSLIDAALHRAGHPVGVKDRSAAEMPRRATNRLDERPVAAQK